MKKLCLLLFLTGLACSLNAQLYKSNGILDNIRAIHIGGNWGRNPIGIPEQPEEYYQFLNSMSINWAAFSIGLHVSNSMDSTVERVYNNVPIATFSDNAVKDAIRGCRNHNLNVMITIGLETQEAASSSMPVNRWQFGDPNIPASDASILEANWPWSTTHPLHTQFVSSWWNSYTKEVVYFAKIAEQEGVKLFVVGAEMDRLFRTRSGGSFTNHYKENIKALVDSVKKYFTGYVSYELHWSTLTDPAFYGPGSDYLWEDAGFDVVGVSSYFRLVNSQPTRVLGVDELEAGWNNIFTNYLIPLQNRNPGKKIVFYEFGYTDDIASPYNAITNEFTNKVFTDSDGDGKDDGEEQQANILDAFYKVNTNNGRLIAGTFLWNNDISNNIDWGNSFGAMRTCSIRNKLAQAIVSLHYTANTPLPQVPVLVSPADGVQNQTIYDVNLKWSHAEEAGSYNIRLSSDNTFSTVLVNVESITTASYILQVALNPSTTYYWTVKSKNTAGESNWSQVFSFTTGAVPAVPVLEYPANQAVNIPVTLQLRWQLSAGAASYDLMVSENLSFNPFRVNLSGLTGNTFQLINLLNSQTYYWKMRCRNNIGQSEWTQVNTFVTTSSTGIAEKQFPKEFILYQNYPNPFNPITTIKYSFIETQNFASQRVTIKVYDLLGREIATIVNGEKSAGIYTVQFDGKNIPSGVYICLMQTGEFKQYRKMVLLK